MADDFGTIIRCKALSFATCFQTVGNLGGGTCSTWINCYASAPSTTGFNCQTGSKHKFISCTCTGGAGSNHFLTSANDTTYLLCISKSAANAANCFSLTSAIGGLVWGCVAWTPGASGIGIVFGSACQGCMAINCVTVACLNGYEGSPLAGLLNCSDYNSSTPVDTGFSYNNGFITLGGDPFTNASGNDFSLNNTAGAGASLRGAGYPSAFLGISTTSYPDVGAVQTQATPPATGGGVPGHIMRTIGGTYIS